MFILRNYLSTRITLVSLFLLIIVVCYAPAVFSGESGPQNQVSLFDKLTSYVWSQRVQITEPVTDLEVILALFVVDFLVSWFCLWVAIFLFTGKFILDVKSCLWFLCLFNVTRTTMLLLIRFAWVAVDLFIIGARPDLKVLFIDYLSIGVPLCIGGLYVWLLARTFGFKSFAAWGSFIACHSFYFVIIFLMLSAFSFEQTPFFVTARQKIGLRSAVRAYSRDVQNIVSKRGLDTLLRFTAFHL